MRVVLLCAGIGLALCVSADRKPFNNDYRFHFGVTPEAVLPEFDDSAWGAVGLPHSFSIPYFRSRHFPIGEGWYRKTFTMPEVNPGKRYSLYFEAAFQHCDVYLNGTRVGGHEGGYTGFEVPLTPALKPEKNVLSVRVDNFWDAQLPPRAGEHVFSGGLYRDVWWVETGDVFIEKGRIKITTPEVSETAAKVAWKLNLKNDSATERTCTLRLHVSSRTGNASALERTFSVTLPASGTLPLSGMLDLETPLLWSPDTPHLYGAAFELTDGKTGELLERLEETFGVRWFNFSATEGFFLNGKHLVLRGANRHQDAAGWGDAVSNRAHERDAELLKACGMNFVRGSHYPHDKAFLDACDRLGLLFWSENTFWGIGGFGGEGYWNASAYPVNSGDWSAFEAADARILEEMIEERFNHPSVIVWGLSNEPFFTHASVMERAHDHIRAQLARVETLDPSRPGGVGGAQRQGFDKLGGIIGYNGDGARFPAPGGPSIVTEYGSHVANRPGVYAPTYGETTENVPAWRAGQALWCAFHHGSIAGDMGRMGMIDYFRLPLRQWYWYRNAYAGIAPPQWVKPGKAAALRLSADRAAIRCDGTDDALIQIQVVDANGQAIDNNPEVTLRIAQGPGEFPTGSVITFRHNTDIDIREGLAAIALRAWHTGEIRLIAESPELPSAGLILKAVAGESEAVAWREELKAVWQKPRVYRAGPFARQISDEEVRSNLAYTRPVRVSSQESRNPAEAANDADPATRWCAADGTYPQWWQVDLENFYRVKDIEIIFEGEAGFMLRAEVSDDGATWKSGAFWNGETMNLDYIRLPLGDVRARFLRVTFLNARHQLWAGMREIRVSGKTGD